MYNRFLDVHIIKLGEKKPYETEPIIIQVTRKGTKGHWPKSYSSGFHEAPSTGLNQVWAAEGITLSGPHPLYQLQESPNLQPQSFSHSFVLLKLVLQSCI